MKTFLLFFAFSASLLCSFGHIKNESLTKVDNQMIKVCSNPIDCEVKLDKIFTWTINKKQDVIHAGQYCHEMCDLIFSDECHVDANTRIDLIISLLLYQRRYAKTIVMYSSLYKMNKVNYSLLMLFAPLRTCYNDTLSAIKASKFILNKLDSTHLDFVLKTESLLSETTDTDCLNDDYYCLISRSFIQKWFVKKYEKYYLNL